MTAAAINLENRRRGASLAALWPLYLLSMRQNLHGKRWMVMGGLFLLPVGLAAIVRAHAPDAPGIFLEFLLAFMFIPQAMLPLCALTYASGMIQDELEEQTITYPLMRPIPKWGLYLVKLAATLTTVMTLTAIFTFAIYAAIFAGSATPSAEWLPRSYKAIGLHCMAAGAYCCLFGLLGMLTKRSLVAGVLYCGLIEGLLGNLPFAVRNLTVIFYSRLIAYRVLPFLYEGQRGRFENFSADAWQLDIRHDPDLLQYPTMRNCFIVLLAGSAACGLVGAIICWRREFYVKTPEKT